MFALRPALCVLVVCSLVSPLGQPHSTAVLDRFEGERAVLVTDAGETVVVPREELPHEGRHVDAVFRITVAHGTVASLSYDTVGTRHRRRRAQRRFDRLAVDAPARPSNASVERQH